MGRTLTKPQLEAWAAFEQSADMGTWGPALTAWAERFPWPPMGDPRDDEGKSQRSILWRVISPEIGGRPHDAAMWIRKAPARANAFAVVGYVDAAWKRYAAGVDDAIGPVINEDPFVRQMEVRSEAREARRTMAAIRDVLDGRR